jgi:hypothetical protein
MTPTPSQRRFTAKSCALTLLQAASMLLAAGAQAQTDPCEQLKAVLAARIEATGVRGYSLETVPAGTPLPPGAKAIGTCQSGASKVLYRRWGAARPSSDGPDTARPASAPQAAVVPNEQTRRAPTVRDDRSVRPAPASAPVPPPQPVEAEAVRAVDRAVAPPEQVPVEKVVVAEVSLAQRTSEFMAENWRWILALVFVPIAGWLWAWRAHRSAYDEAGLPRGPKL